MKIKGNRRIGSHKFTYAQDGAHVFGPGSSVIELKGDAPCIFFSNQAKSVKKPIPVHLHMFGPPCMQLSPDKETDNSVPSSCIMQCDVEPSCMVIEKAFSDSARSELLESDSASFNAFSDSSGCELLESDSASFRVIENDLSDCFDCESINQLDCESSCAFLELLETDSASSQVIKQLDCESSCAFLEKNLWGKLKSMDNCLSSFNGGTYAEYNTASLCSIVAALKAEGAGDLVDFLFIDIGAGFGTSMTQIAQHFPHSSCVGIECDFGRSMMFFTQYIALLKQLMSKKMALTNERIAYTSKDILHFRKLDGDFFHCFDEAMCPTTVLHILKLFVESKRAKWLFSVKLLMERELMEYLESNLPSFESRKIVITKKVTLGYSRTKTGLLITKCSAMFWNDKTCKSIGHSLDGGKPATAALYMSLDGMFCEDRSKRISEMERISNAINCENEIQRKNRHAICSRGFGRQKANKRNGNNVSHVQLHNGKHLQVYDNFLDSAEKKWLGHIVATNMVDIEINKEGGQPSVGIMGTKHQSALNRIKTRAANLVGLSIDHVKHMDVMYWACGSSRSPKPTIEDLPSCARRALPSRSMFASCFYVYLFDVANGGHLHFPSPRGRGGPVKIAPQSGRAVVIPDGLTRCGINRVGEGSEAILLRIYFFS